MTSQFVTRHNGAYWVRLWCGTHHELEGPYRWRVMAQIMA